MTFRKLKEKLNQKSYQIPEDRSLTPEVKAKIKDFSITLLEFLQLYRFAVSFPSETAIDKLFAPYLKTLKPDEKVPSIQSILDSLSLNDTEILDELTVEELHEILSNIYIPESDVEIGDFNEIKDPQLLSRIRNIESVKSAITVLEMMKTLKPNYKLFKELKGDKEVDVYGTHYLDLVSPNIDALDSTRRKLLNPLIKGIEQYYTYMPTSPPKLEKRDLFTVNYHNKVSSDAQEWLSAYAIDLGFPMEKSQQYYDIARLSAAAYRQLDIVRDWGYIQSLENAQRILDTFKTESDRLKWFKLHQEKLLEMTDEIRAMMSKDGESYLQHNELIIQWHIKNKLADFSGTRLSQPKAHYIPGNSGEMDNPEERAIIQLISIMLKASMDHIEFAKLSQVKNFNELYDFYIWRFMRLRAREMDIGTKNPEDLLKPFEIKPEDEEEEDIQEDIQEESPEEEGEAKEENAAESTNDTPETEEPSPKSEIPDDGEKNQEENTDTQNESSNNETPKDTSDDPQSKKSSENSSSEDPSEKKSDKDKTQETETDKPLKPKYLTGRLKREDPNLTILNQVLKLNKISEITAESYDKALENLGLKERLVFKSADELNQHNALLEIGEAYDAVRAISTRHHAKDENAFAEAKTALAAVLEKHRVLIEKVSIDSPEELNSIERILGYLESNKSFGDATFEEMLKNPTSVPLRDDLFYKSKISTEDLADIMGLLSSGRHDSKEVIKVVLKIITRQFNLSVDNIPKYIERDDPSEILAYLLGFDKPTEEDMEFLLTLFENLRRFPEAIEKARAEDPELGEILDIYNLTGNALLEAEADEYDVIPDPILKQTQKNKLQDRMKKAYMKQVNVLREIATSDKSEYKKVFEVWSLYNRVLNRIENMKLVDPHLKNIDIEQLVKNQMTIDKLSNEISGSSIVEDEEDLISHLNPEWNELLSNYKPLSILEEPLNPEHYLDKRLYVNQLVLLKFLKLRKLGYELGIYQSQPLFDYYTNILRTYYTQMIDYHFWHRVPHEYDHRNVLNQLKISNVLSAHKIYRELMFLVNPLIWKTQHYVPKDDPGDIVVGQNALEVVMQNLDGRHRGTKTPDFEDRPLKSEMIETPPESYFAVYYKNKRLTEDERNMLKNLFLLLLIILSGIVSIKEAISFATNGFIHQDFLIRLQSLPTFFISPIQYLDNGIKIFDLLIFQYVKFVFKSVNLLFQKNLEPEVESFPEKVEDFINLDKAFEADMMKARKIGEMERLEQEFMRYRGMGVRSEKEDLEIYEEQKMLFENNPDRYYKEPEREIEDSSDPHARAKAILMTRSLENENTDPFGYFLRGEDWNQYYKHFLIQRGMDPSKGDPFEPGYDLEDVLDRVILVEDPTATEYTDLKKKEPPPFPF